MSSRIFVCVKYIDGKKAKTYRILVRTFLTEPHILRHKRKWKDKMMTIRLSPLLAGHSIPPSPQEDSWIPICQK
jgi:hypothetical protein